MRLIGDYLAKIDTKGRVFLPAVLRKALDAEGVNRLILRTDLFQACLVLYPEQVWNDSVDALRSRLNPYNGQHQNILRRFVADAEPIELDANGRVLIGKRKQSYAHIDKEVRFLAVDDHIEIWDNETFENMMAAEGDLGEQLQNILGT